LDKAGRNSLHCSVAKKADRNLCSVKIHEYPAVQAILLNIRGLEGMPMSMLGDCRISMEVEYNVAYKNGEFDLNIYD
jgi:hypothetical protein